MALNFFLANVQCVSIVYAKYQMASRKALVQVDFPVHALSKHQQNPYLEATSQNMVKSKTLSFCQNNCFQTVLLYSFLLFFSI